MVAVVVKVGHRGLEGALEDRLVVLEKPKYHTPDNRSEPRENRALRFRNDALLDGQTRESNHDARQKIQIDLKKEDLMVVFQEYR